MIFSSSPVLVLDDESKELMDVTIGLGVCDIPSTPILVSAGTPVFCPDNGFAGVRLLVTDLHILGATQNKVEQYASALVSLIKKLVRPTYYVLIMWSNYQDDADETEKYLRKNLPQNLHPIGFASLSKEDVIAAAEDTDVRSAIRQKLGAILGKYPQIRALMDWEAAASQASSETTNQLVRSLSKTGLDAGDPAVVKSVLARMAQEALGAKQAAESGPKGLVQAFLPILQDVLEQQQHVSLSALSEFMAISGIEKIKLPTPALAPTTSVNAVLNDFFVHDERGVTGKQDRGAVVRLPLKYLPSNRFWHDFGLSVSNGEWKEAVCSEFALHWNNVSVADRLAIKEDLDGKNILAVELSAVCDHAQDKPRSLRYLLAMFLPNGAQTKRFIGSKNDQKSNDSIYVTPEISLEEVSGRLVISCRVFASRTYKQWIDGVHISRLRKDVIDEISHLYTSHMRRPGKIAFY